MVSKWPAVKVGRSKNTSVLLVKRTFFHSSNFDGWPFRNQLVFRDVMYIPHFKGLVMPNLDFEAKGHRNTFTFCHGHLKKAILLHKRARVPFDSHIAVYAS